MYKVTIDAGHNADSNVSPVDERYIEGARMWRLGGYLKRALEDYGIEAVLTRPRLTDDPAIAARGRLAADNGSDLFISLHSNAPLPRTNGSYDISITGTVVYYSLTDSDNKELADKLGEVVSEKMGHQFRGSLTREYSEERPDWDYYGVIRNAAWGGCTAAFLIEHGFHTCPKDIAFLMSDGNLQMLAQAEAKVIAEHFGVQKKLYRVQIGAFSSRQNAENYKKQAEADGYQAFVVEV